MYTTPLSSHACSSSFLSSFGTSCSLVLFFQISSNNVVYSTIWFFLKFAISASMNSLFFHSSFLSILISLLSSLVSTWSFLDKISTFVFVFPGICHHSLATWSTILLVYLLSLYGSLKYLRFSWSVQTSNFSIAFNRYCLYFTKAFTITNSSLLYNL